MNRSNIKKSKRDINKVIHLIRESVEVHDDNDVLDDVTEIISVLNDTVEDLGDLLVSSR